MNTARNYAMLANRGSEKTVPPGHLLLRQGEPCEDFVFFRSGLAKAYYNTLEGKEFIKSFISEGDIIASLQAVLANEPSRFNLLTLEPSEVLVVPAQPLLAAMQDNFELLRLVNDRLAQLAMKKEGREYDLLCLSAEQRYRQFREQRPELLSRLTQVDIARYLGITPVALSRIRRRERQAQD